MGPITSSPVALLPRQGWLVLFAFVVPVAFGAVIRQIPPSPSPTWNDLNVAVHVDEVARAHRLWVADHGPGCARSVDHLAPYDDLASAPDAWGQPLHFECARMESGRLIVVWVVSTGPDRERHTSDDITGMDVQSID